MALPVVEAVTGLPVTMAHGALPVTVAGNGSGLPVRFTESMGLPVSLDWIMAGATLDLDFVNDRGWAQGDVPGLASDFVATIRASDAYADDSAGLWSLFSSNVPRITDKGLLVEEARTRLNTYPRDLSNAAWVKGAGVSTPMVNQVGIDGDADGASLVTATVADATAAIYQAFTVTPGTDYTFSFFAKAGTATGLKFAVYDQANAAFIATDQAYTAGAGAFARVSYTFTAPAGCTTARIYPLRNPGSTGTVIIDGVQVEVGLMATSPILATPSSTAARAADVVTVASPPTFGSAYTLFAQAVPEAPAAFASQQNVIQTGLNTNRIVMRRIASNGGRLVAAVGGTGGNIWASAVEWPAGTRSKWASAIAAGDQATSVDGATPNTATLATLPTTPTAIYLGVNSSQTEFFNGWLERVAVYATVRLSNAQIQAITS